MHGGRSTQAWHVAYARAAGTASGCSGADKAFVLSVLTALSTAVPSRGAFACVAESHAGRVVCGRLVEGCPCVTISAHTLEKAFVLDPPGSGGASARLVSSEEVWPDAQLRGAPYWYEPSLHEDLASARVILLYDNGVLRGLAGVERPRGDLPFSADDLSALAGLQPLILQGLKARRREVELERAAAALRVIGELKETVLVVDLEARRIVSVSTGDKKGWTPPGARLETSIVAAIERLLATPAERSAAPARVKSIAILAAAPIADAEEGDGRFAAAHVIRLSGSKAAEGKLSQREAEVARLLVDGYSNVNIAALCGLSTNTVRTFIRRVYTKIGVFNRADLVRQLVRSPGTTVGAGEPRSKRG